MSKPLLGLALAALGGFFLLASYAAKPATSATGDCTLVMGGSITNNWFNTGNFQSKPGIVGGEWESITRGGATVSRIVTGEKLWPDWDSDTINSRCTSNGRLPNRVVFNALWRFDVREVGYSDAQAVGLILDVVAQIRSRINPASEIVLVGIVGSTDANCTVYAATSYDRHVSLIRQAIAQDPTLREGVHPRVPCSQYADADGHLNSTGSSNAATQLAAFFAAPVATPTVTPTPTATPVPALVSCERVATYSNGSKVTTALPLGDC